MSVDFIKVKRFEGHACGKHTEKVATEKVGILIDINAPKKESRDYWFIETSNLKHAVERYCMITGETAFQFREISGEMFYFSSSYSKGVVEESTFSNFASKVEDDQEVIQYEGIRDVYHIF